MLNHFSRVRLFATLWTVARQAPPSRDTKVGCHALLLGIFPTQGSNPPLLHLLHWQAGSLPVAPPGKPIKYLGKCLIKHVQDLYTESCKALLK